MLYLITFIRYKMLEGRVVRKLLADLAKYGSDGVDVGLLEGWVTWAIEEGAKKLKLELGKGQLSSLTYFLIEDLLIRKVIMFQRIREGYVILNPTLWRRRYLFSYLQK